MGLEEDLFGGESSGGLEADLFGDAPAQPNESWLAREGRLILGIGGNADLRSSVIGRTMEGMARPARGLHSLLLVEIRL